MRTMERRTKVRYGLRAAAEFSWKATGQGRSKGTGITRDISKVGAFIVSPRCPPVDSKVSVDIFLPSGQSAFPTFGIRAKAKVLRIDCTENQVTSGFSMCFSKFRLCQGSAGNRQTAPTKQVDSIQENGRKRSSPVVNREHDESFLGIAASRSFPAD